MFQGLINDARRAASSIIGKYLGRAVVAIPFLISGAFATAGLTSTLSELYGTQSAYWIMAAGFTILGALVAVVVNVKEHEIEPEVAVADVAQSGAPPATTSEPGLTPLALLAPLLTNPMGANAALSVARWALRNVPLVILIGLLGMLIWPQQDRGSEAISPSDEGPAFEPGQSSVVG